MVFQIIVQILGSSSNLKFETKNPELHQERIKTIKARRSRLRVRLHEFAELLKILTGAFELIWIHSEAI